MTVIFGFKCMIILTLYTLQVYDITEMLFCIKSILLFLVLKNIEVDILLDE